MARLFSQLRFICVIFTVIFTLPISKVLLDSRSQATFSLNGSGKESWNNVNSVHASYYCMTLLAWPLIAASKMLIIKGSPTKGHVVHFNITKDT